MSYSIENLKTYDNWVMACLKKTTKTYGSTTTDYLNCQFVPNKNYPDLSKIKISMTGSTAWYNNYSEFVPKSERLMLDMVFIIALFWFFFGMIKFVFKVLFK